MSRRRISNRPEALPRTCVGGRDLGPSMRPQDVLIWLRHHWPLSNDEIVEAMRLGARIVRDRGDDALVELTDADRQEAIAQAEDVTAARVDAWRRRGREMTWLELRVLLLGIAALDGEEEGAA